MIINLQNVEELVFYDKKLQLLIPEFNHLFSQWSLAKRVPALRSLGLRSLMDFLNDLTDEHKKIMESYFGIGITVDKMDYHIAKHYDCTLEEAENKLNTIGGFSNFSSYRDGNHLYISFWR